MHRAVPQVPSMLHPLPLRRSGAVDLQLSGPPDALVGAIDALRRVRDPEVDADILELGLVESLRIGDGEAWLQLVTPGPDCPLSDFTSDHALRALQGALPDTDIYVSHDPWVEWRPQRVGKALRRQLGWPAA